MTDSTTTSPALQTALAYFHAWTGHDIIARVAGTEILGGHAGRPARFAAGSDGEPGLVLTAAAVGEVVVAEDQPVMA